MTDSQRSGLAPSPQPLRREIVVLPPPPVGIPRASPSSSSQRRFLPCRSACLHRGLHSISKAHADP